MNKFKFYFILLLAGIAIVSCNKKSDDEVVTVPLRDYKEQYAADQDSIVKYLKTNYIQEVTADFDIKFAKIPAGGTQTSIWDQTTYPLQERQVYSNDVTYTVYYLITNEGSGSAPTNTDKIFASYTGYLLNNSSFDSSNGIPVAFNLFSGANENTVIEGWSEIFPKFKTGTSVFPVPSDGVITYSGYGAGAMFLPSGLGYFGTSTSAIPVYSPLIFTFKLFDLQRMDNEYRLNASTGLPEFIGDGIPDYLEDINKDGYLYDLRNKTKYPNPPDHLLGDDTDGDGIPDFLDIDDDGDGYTTLFEITKPDYDQDPAISGLSKYYPYDPVQDNPRTPNYDETERLGIPAFSASGTPDYTSPGRLRLHLDKDHYKAKP